jgi:hypothetical protein
MTLAHAQYSGDGKLISKYVRCRFSLLCEAQLNTSTVRVTEEMGRVPFNKLTDSCKPVRPLLNSTACLISSSFRTEDGLNKANMTNLAIKGIIGVKCMAVMSQAAGQADDSKQFNVFSVLLPKYGSIDL